MNFLSVRKIVGLAVAFVSLGIVVPVFAQTGGVNGKATKQDGSVCAKCIVIVDRQEIKGTYKAKTNNKGEFVYIGLPIGNYKITLEDPSGQQLFYVVKHIGLGDPTQVDFDLPKLMVEQQQAQQEEMKKNPEMAKKAGEQQAQQQAEQQKQQQAEKQFTGLKQLFEQGNTLYGQQQYKEAADAFEKALTFAKGKNVPVVLSRLADTYQKAHENDKAIETYQKAIALSPEDAGLHNNLGSVYAQVGKLSEADGEFEKAVQIDPANAARYYFNVGAILYNAGKMDEALAAFKKVITADPKNAEAYYLEGQALIGKATMTPDGKVKAPDGTLEAFQTYLKLSPTGPNADAARAMIQTLQGSVTTQYSKKKK